LRPEGLHWMTFTLVLCVVSGVANVPLAVWEATHEQALPSTALAVFAALYVGVFASTVAYGAWSRGVELIGAARAGVFLHLVPVYGAILSVLFLGERIHAFHGAGLLLILAGVALAARKE
jgi:drug/metabolite transporter (DMT)-like permease